MRLEDAERLILSLELFGMRFGLDRMRRLLTALGSPQEKFKAVHVVGTNGKTSTVRMTAAILRRHGYRVGGTMFPSADVDEDHLRRLVRARWGAGDGTIEVHEFSGQLDHGYAGIVLAAVRRPAAPPPKPNSRAASSLRPQSRYGAWSPFVSTLGRHWGKRPDEA